MTSPRLLRRSRRYFLVPLRAYQLRVVGRRAGRQIDNGYVGRHDATPSSGGHNGRSGQCEITGYTVYFALLIVSNARVSVVKYDDIRGTDGRSFAHLPGLRDGVFAGNRAAPCSLASARTTPAAVRTSPYRQDQPVQRRRAEEG
ncbi:MAG: hypothetical protein ABI382_14090 [Nakamurella sp.]